MENKIKVIIFDLGGVLLSTKEYIQEKSHFHRNLGVHLFISKKLNISLDQYFDSIDTYYAKSIEGKISEKRVLRILSKNLKISEKKLIKLYSIAYNNFFKKNYWLFNQVESLKKRGYILAILSDQWYLSKKALVSKKILSPFSVSIISCDVGMRKPNPKIYKLILKRLKRSSSECLFIDNQRWNTDAAEKIGIKTILFRNNKELSQNKIWKSLFSK